MEKRLEELLTIAIHYGTSDIHFSVFDEEIKIEFRYKDKLVQLKKQEDDLPFFRYLQYKANLDLGNSYLPQTGRFDVMIQNERVSLRFAVMKSYRMTSGVLRILNAQNRIDLLSLTYDQNVIRIFKSLENHRSGLFVFSGPTGSGKTTTLYTIMNQIKNKKIYTLEDPIEVYSKNFVQLQINEKQDLGYSQGIKQLLRHAPDIIMIGEIRDEEAAKMALRCALTGHLVLTSIHSSNCFLAIERLIELGVSRYQLLDVLIGISNQRLYSSIKNQSKVGIYEILTRKGIGEYFKNEIPKDFIPIQYAIKQAIQKGLISSTEAIKDLDE
ncbi:ATPase, T2SS/T4P/T4SS family [Anaerorhabdus furcosa]|uniref:Competence protein ComGA n=1 Tax=Anaerorhabdus furcosa TaxID=118967 RepID=A0A1T4P779_9FIRM|nr:ATPase, T2SS/T4P/T4SS family [Anaerorhabdus furcosa]SJZ87425.1 competence protein ComGA [Anaerorhabdus furcosa]